jgi:hypothetical protein
MTADRAIRYLAEALASTGFVLVHWRPAARLRWDLFGTGQEADQALGLARRHNRLHRPPEAFEVMVDVAGLGSIPCWCWTTDDLAQRVRAATGFEATLVALTHEPIPVAAARPALPVRPDPGGDLHAGRVTREPGRTCSSCENFTAGHACAVPKVSGVERPSPRALRRCLAFQPLFDATDMRDGGALWPELAEAAGAVT